MYPTNKKQRTQEGLYPRAEEFLYFIKDSKEEREKVRSTVVRGSPETQGCGCFLRRPLNQEQTVQEAPSINLLRLCPSGLWPGSENVSVGEFLEL